MASILKVNTIQDATNSNTAISVDSSGRVTTPARPVFLARKTSSDQQDGTANTKIVFSQVDINQGSHYDSSNSRFTAPVTALYYFHANLRLASVGKLRVFNFAIYKNGSAFYTRLGGAGAGADFDSGSGSDHPYASGSTILSLNANDYVELFTGDEFQNSGTFQIQSGLQSSQFMGYLLA